MGAPVGPAGCEGTPGRGAAGLAGGAFRSDLLFGSGRRARIEETSVVASGAWLPARNLSVQLAAGAVLDGHLSLAGTTHDVSPGPLVSASVARRFAFGEGERWFVIASGTLATSVVWTQAPGGARTTLNAWDGRAGASAGVALGSWLRPYVLARAFGGPVFWRINDAAATGTDAHHFQLGAGTNVILGRFSLQAEASLVGEQAVSLGAVVTF